MTHKLVRGVEQSAHLRARHDPTAVPRKPIVMETALILAMICMGVLLYLAARPPDL